MRVADLLDRARRPRLDEQSAVDLTRSLRYRGLRIEPSLFTVLAQAGEEEWDPADIDSPGIAAGPERLGDVRVTLRADPTLALDGVLLVGMAAACLGLYRSLAYMFAACVGAGFAVALGLRFDELDRRLPAIAPRGRLLGAGAAVVTIALALVVFVVLRKLSGL